MKTEGMVQQVGAGSEAKADAREQLAQHLAQQPQSTRTFDKVMKGLEVAGLAVIAGYLAWAIYVSINWTVPQQIVAVWLAFPVSVVVLLVLVGVHSVRLRAFLPITLPGGSTEFVTGPKAVSTGMGLVVAAILGGAFWGALSWGIWANNGTLVGPLTHFLGVVIAVGIVVGVVSDLYKKLFRSR